MIELEWLLIAFAVIMSSLAFSAAFEGYADKQCRIAAIANNVPAEKISQACGKQTKEK